MKIESLIWQLPCSYYYDNRLCVHFAQESSISTSFYEKKKIKSQDSSRVVGNLSFISSLSLPRYDSDLNNSRSLYSCALHCVHVLLSRCARYLIRQTSRDSLSFALANFPGDELLAESIVDRQGGAIISTTGRDVEPIEASKRDSEISLGRHV